MSNASIETPFVARADDDRSEAERSRAVKNRIGSALAATFRQRALDRQRCRAVQGPAARLDGARAQASDESDHRARTQLRDRAPLRDGAPLHDRARNGAGNAGDDHSAVERTCGDGYVDVRSAPGDARFLDPETATAQAARARIRDAQKSHIDKKERQVEDAREKHDAVVREAEARGLWAQMLSRDHLPAEAHALRTRYRNARDWHEHSCVERDLLLERIDEYWSGESDTWTDVDIEIDFDSGDGCMTYLGNCHDDYEAAVHEATVYDEDYRSVAVWLPASDCVGATCASTNSHALDVDSEYCGACWHKWNGTQKGSDVECDTNLAVVEAPTNPCDALFATSMPTSGFESNGGSCSTDQPIVRPSVSDAIRALVPSFVVTSAECSWWPFANVDAENDDASS